jgi:hypothetical protein
VRLHALTWGAAGTAEPDRAKPAGISIEKLKDAVAFLYRDGNMQQVW